MIENDEMEYSVKFNAEQTFESFVEVEANSFANKLLTAFPENKEIDNQLICIHGPVGVGKTHLLNAVGNKLKNKKTIISVTIAQLLNDFTKNLRQMTMDKFRDKYYGCDILLIDDLDYIAGKNQTQEELYFIVSNLINENKHVILASNKNPKKLLKLDEKFASYLDRSLQVEINSPSYDMVLKITQSLIDKKGLELDQKVIEYIAKNVDGNIFQVEGILKTLDAYTKLMAQQPTMKDVKKLLTSS